MLWDEFTAPDPLQPATPPPPAPPFGSRLPDYGTLAYFEKLGVVILTAVAVLWMLFHLVSGRPGQAAMFAGRAR